MPAWRFAAVVLAAALVVAGVRAPASNNWQTTAIGELTPELPRERDLAAGETHRFALWLDASQHVRVSVQEHGVDVTVTLIGASGQKLAMAEGPPATVGIERLSFIADNAGRIIVEIHALDRFPDRGRYRVTLTDVRPATEHDRASVAAERLIADGERLRGISGAANIREAMKRFEAALPLAAQAGDPVLEGDALTGIGRASHDLGEVAKALEPFRQAIAKYAAAGTRDREAMTLNHLALAHEFRAERPQAIELLNRALELTRDAGDIRAEAVTLNNLGLTYHNHGDKDRGLKYYLAALPFHRRAGNRRAEATTLSNLGVLYDQLGDRSAALEYLQQALPLRRAHVGDLRELAGTLTNIGATYRNLDDYPKALEFYHEAIPHWQAAGDRTSEGATRNNIASALNALGETQQAIDAYREALRLHRETEFVTGQANILNNLGVLYKQLGDHAAAIATYEEALAKNRAAKNRAGESAVLVNLGLTWLDRGNRDRALQLFTEGRALAQQVSDPNREAAAVTAMARAHAAGGDLARASETFREARERHRAVRSKRGEAEALLGLGRVEAQLGNGDAAMTHYAAARDLYSTIADPRGEARALYRSASAHREAGRLDDALNMSRSARRLADSLRHRVASADLRSTYLGSVRSYYELEIDVLMRLHTRMPAAGHDVDAFGVSERARARSLLEVLVEAGASATEGIDPALVARERALAAALAAKAERRTRLLSGPHTLEQAEAALRDATAATRELDDLRARMRAAGARYASLTDIQPLTLAEVRADLLDENTTLLEYALGAGASYVWIVSRTGHVSVVLPPQSTIEAAARRFHDSLKNPQSSEWEAAGRALSGLILAPAADHLRTRRLVVVADGALQYIPFAALPVTATGEYEPAIVRYEIISAPSASTFASLRRPSASAKASADKSTPSSASRMIAVVADPVFSRDDARVTATVPAKTPRLTQVPARSPAGAIRAGESFSRLIGSRREAAAILGLAPPAASRSALDFDASRTTALEQLSEYRFVHFATHGFLDSQKPELSGLVLSLVDRSGQPQNGYLRLPDIYNLRLSADLVVLSACQTALGRDVHGEGLLGLVRGFMSAGAPRVVASLWQVDDRATTALMTEMYKVILSARPKPAGAALRDAQLAIRSQPRWRAPYYCCRATGDERARAAGRLASPKLVATTASEGGLEPSARRLRTPPPNA